MSLPVSGLPPANTRNRPSGETSIAFWILPDVASLSIGLEPSIGIQWRLRAFRLGSATPKRMRVPSGVHMALDFIDDAVRAQN